VSGSPLWSVRIAGCLTPALALVLVAGCATPQYAVRQTPLPEESADALAIERAISQVQGREFARQGARPILPIERLHGFAVQPLVDALRRVTERPHLAYRAYLYTDADPNAAALADGRIYLSTGMLEYLAGRGSRPDELAFILSHELAHTVAQHLVKRFRMLQRQQLLMALVAAGAAAATREGSAGAQQAGRLVVDAAALLQDVANSGYSQEQELEADQLGIRYVIRAGFDPRRAIALLEDFEQRFETPWPFLRTHPYVRLRRDYLLRYLTETGQGGQPAGFAPRAPTGGSGAAQPSMDARAARRKHLEEIQRLYPKGSVSWQNLQRQLDEP